MTRRIHFTQYVYPDGHQKDVFIDVDDETGALAEIIAARGLVFECEVLRTGQVSLTITDPDEGDVDIRVVPNGPEVPAAVRALIHNFIQPGESIQ